MSPTAITAPIALAVLKVALVACLGFVVVRRGIVHQAGLADMSSLVVGVTAPCLNFVNALSGSAAASISASLALIISAPIVLGLGWAGGAGFARLFGIAGRSWRPVVAAATFQNASYLPLAVATAVLPSLAGLFPPPHEPPGRIAGAAIVDVSLFSVLYLPLFWGLGLWWLQGEAEGERRPLTWRTLLPPPVVGVLAGYVFGLTPLRFLLMPPGASLHVGLLVAQDVGQLTVPLANLALGGMLALALGGGHLRARDAACAALAKLVFVPAAVFAALAASRPWWDHAPAPALAAFVILLEGASPPATNLAVMSRSKGIAGGSAEIVPGLLLVAYPVSLLTMPLWLTAFFALLSHP